MPVNGTIKCTSKIYFAAPKSNLVSGGSSQTLAVPCYSTNDGCLYNYNGALSLSAVSTDTIAVMIFTWDFGDGTAVVTGTGLSATTHNYVAAGTYQGSLTVRDTQGGTDTRNFTIVHTTDTPVPIIEYEETDTCEFSFEGNRSLNRTCTGVLTYAWNFGDTNTSTDTNPVHTYATAGVYTVTLTVTDPANQSVTLTIIINCATSSSMPNPIRQYPFTIATWGVASGGFYTITILQTTHLKAAASPIVALVQGDDGTDWLPETDPDAIMINKTTGDVSIRVPEIGNARFAGRILIFT